MCLLEHFVCSSTEQELERTCKKVPIFAGFWFESKFFAYYRQISSIFIRCIKPGRKVPKQLELTITGVVELGNDQDHLTIGSLYELIPLLTLLGIYSSTIQKPNGLYLSRYRCKNMKIIEACMICFSELHKVKLQNKHQVKLQNKKHKKIQWSITTANYAKTQPNAEADRKYYCYTFHQNNAARITYYQC